MRRRPEIPRPRKEKELSIPIKDSTAKMLTEAEAMVQQAVAQHQAALAQRDNIAAVVLSERGIKKARLVRITDTKPRQLVVAVVR
jgi:hypothetical protein